MTDFSANELRNWLLHRLDAARTTALDAALFNDAALADRLEEARDDLLDDDAHGRLSADERRLLRQHLAATSEDRLRLRIAHALARERVTRARPVRRRVAVWGGIGLAAGVLLAVGVAWQRFEISPVRSNGPIANTALPVISLAAVRQRGAESDVVTLPRYAGDVRLQAEIGDATAEKRYALIVGDGDRVVFNASGLTPREAGPFHFVEAVVPATALASGIRRISIVEDSASKRVVATWEAKMGASP